MAPLQTARESFDLKQLSSGLFRAPLEPCPVLLRRSASRVPHRFWVCRHLCHFPLCTALPCPLVGRHSHEYYWHSVTLGLASGRPSRVPSPRNVLERRRLPIHPLQCPHWVSAIAQGVPSAKAEPMAHDGVGLQMRYRRVCGFTPGDWSSNNPVLALSLRCCRTTAHTSSAVPRFTNMLLSPRPFGFRSVVHLGVINPELRPPLVAIPAVRDTAHAFIASGSRLRGTLCLFTFFILPGDAPGTACAFG
jgi:hypothetical protein